MRADFLGFHFKKGDFLERFGREIGKGKGKEDETDRPVRDVGGVGKLGRGSEIGLGKQKENLGSFLRELGPLRMLDRSWAQWVA